MRLLLRDVLSLIFTLLYLLCLTLLGLNLRLTPFLYLFLCLTPFLCLLYCLRLPLDMNMLDSILQHKQFLIPVLIQPLNKATPQPHKTIDIRSPTNLIDITIDTIDVAALNVDQFIVDAISLHQDTIVD